MIDRDSDLEDVLKMMEVIERCIAIACDALRIIAKDETDNPRIAARIACEDISKIISNAEGQVGPWVNEFNN